MKSRDQRMREFVNYHIHGDGECNNVVLKEWASRHQLNLQQRYELAFFFAVTYCVESAIVLFGVQNVGIDKYRLTQLKPTLIFQSDRKYMKMADRFEKCVLDHLKNHWDVNQFIKKTCEGTTMDLDRAIKHVSTWTMFGRFASFLFLETFCELTQYAFKNTTIDWKNGDTATSGLLNLFGFDEAADHFDKTDKLPFDYKTMNSMLALTLNEIERAGGNPNVTEVETSLCAYRKFYKGSRYNGYYLDRMLEEILAMKGTFPEISEELTEIRKEKFNHNMLGEIGGWRGIRPKKKKQYKETGLI